MAKSANYRVQVRRRREGKTDYQARKAMVISRRVRLVTRPSIKNVTVQMIIAKPQGDQVLVAANSRELVKKYGWKAATGNIPAAYLTGLLCGLKAKAASIDSAILDIGMVIPSKGSKVFAILHGVLDAGIEVPHGEEKIVPDRAKGDHIARYAKSLSDEDHELYAAKFSKYNAEGVAPEKVAEHFSKVRAAISESFKGTKIAPEPESAPEPKTKPVAPKPEAKAAPKVVSKPEAKAIQAPKTEAKVEEPKAEVKVAPKVEAKAPKVAEAKPEVKVAKEAAPTVEKASKAKAKAAPKEKAKKAPVKVTKEKAAPKEKAPAKEKAPPAKEKTPAKKATKKGEKKE
jgi:large subunit ribosomal protein L18